MGCQHVLVLEGHHRMSGNTWSVYGTRQRVVREIVVLNMFLLCLQKRILATPCHSWRCDSQMVNTLEFWSRSQVRSVRSLFYVLGKTGVQMNDSGQPRKPDKCSKGEGGNPQWISIPPWGGAILLSLLCFSRFTFIMARRQACDIHQSPELVKILIRVHQRTNLVISNGIDIFSLVYYWPQLPQL